MRKRAMTVAVATLVAAGLVGPASACRRRPCRRRPTRCRSSSARSTAPATRPSGRSSAFGGRSGASSTSSTASPPRCRPTGSTRCAACPGVESVTEDAGLALSERRRRETQAAQAGSLYTIANEVTGASAMWDAGYTGKGVDVAVIDSGVVPVDGFTAPGKVVYGPGPDLRGRTRRRRTWTPTVTAPTWPASSPAGTTPRALDVRGNSSRLRRHGAGLPHRQHQGR